MTPHPTREEKKKRKPVLTLEDMAHFIIFRELDKLHVFLPYEKATKICFELSQLVQYRTRADKPK